MLYVNSVIDRLTHCRHPVHVTCLHFSCTRLYMYVIAVACVCQGPALARAIPFWEIQFPTAWVSCTLLRYSEDMIFKRRVKKGEPRRVWFLAQLSDFFLRDRTFGAWPCSVRHLPNSGNWAAKTHRTASWRSWHSQRSYRTSHACLLPFFLLSPKRKQSSAFTTLWLVSLLLSWQTWTPAIHSCLGDCFTAQKILAQPKPSFFFPLSSYNLLQLAHNLKNSPAYQQYEMKQCCKLFPTVVKTWGQSKV